MPNFFDEMVFLAEKYTNGYFEERDSKMVENISFSAQAVGPEKITSSANIADSDTFSAFMEDLDKVIANTFIDLFKKSKDTVGSIMDIAFSYSNSNVVLQLVANKSKSKKRKSKIEVDGEKVSVDWYLLKIANITIDAKDSDQNSKNTYLEQAEKNIKNKKIKNDSPLYIKTLLSFIKEKLDGVEDKVKKDYSKLEK